MLINVLYANHIFLRDPAKPRELLKVLLGPPEINVSFKFCMGMVKVLDYYPQAVDACMAPNILSEVDVMWQVPKCDDQFYVPY